MKYFYNFLILDTQEDKNSDNSGSDSPGEVKRNSVKDKIAVLDKNSNEQNPNSAIMKPKSSSLPKSVPGIGVLANKFY